MAADNLAINTPYKGWASEVTATASLLIKCQMLGHFPNNSLYLEEPAAEQQSRSVYNTVGGAAGLICRSRVAGCRLQVAG